MKKITPKQKKILTFFDVYCRKHGYPPSLREICKRFSMSSTNGARYHLQRLKALGYVKIEPYRSRGVKRIGEPSVQTQSDSPFRYNMPILGQVPAGPFDFAAPDIREDEVGVDPTFFGSYSDTPELFGLRVKGDSMTEAGIFDGDVVVVRPQEVAHDGQIVVARVEDEATVKRFRRQNGEMVLLPANPAYSPIHVPDRGGSENGQDVSIVGVVVGLIRSL